MAGPTIGYAQIKVDYDGDRLPAQAAKLGKKAGQGSGWAFTDGFSEGLNSWTRRLTETMVKGGKVGGKKFINALNDELRGELQGTSRMIVRALAHEKGFNQFAKSVGGSEKAVEQLNQSLQSLVDTGELSWINFREMQDDVQGWADALRDSERAIEAEKKAREAADASAKASAAQREKDAELARQATERARVENDRLAKSLKDVNLALGNEGNWRTLIKNTDDSASSWQRLVKSIQNLNESGKISNDQTRVMFSRMRELSIATDDAAKSNDKLNDSMKRQGPHLSHNARQWTLIIGSILAGGPEIAALGSLIGSTLTIAAGAVGAFGVGIGVAIAAFRGFTGEIEDLPEAVRPAAEAFQSLGDTFDELQDKIQVSALQNSAAAWESLKGTVEQLTPAFLTVAEAVGRVIDKFATGLAPGTAALGELQFLIEKAAPVFETLADAAFRFGDGIRKVFVVSVPFVEKFSRKILELADAFADWTESAEGTAAITEWFENAEQLAGPLLELVKQIAAAFNEMVTPEVVEQTGALLTNLAAFIEGPFGKIMEIFAQLDIFGVLVQLFLDLGTALTPILDLLVPIADYLNTLFLTISPMISIILSLVQLALAPLIVGLEAWFTGMDKLLTILQPVFDALAELAGLIVTDVIAAFTGVADEQGAFIDQILNALVPAIDEAVRVIREEWVPWWKEHGKKAVEELLSGIRDFWNWCKENLIPFLAVAVPVAIQAAVIAFNILKGVIAGIKAVVGPVVDAIQNLLNLLSKVPGARDAAAAKGGGGMAAGGVVFGPTRRLIGEAGPEAVVPLNRPLSRVDPSVRALSAIAQGQSSSMASGGVAGGGRTVIVEAGAITLVTNASNPQNVAAALLDRIVVSLPS